MALKTPQITPTRKIVVRTVSQALPRAHYQRCPQCDTLFMLPKMKSHESAFCPRCDAKIRDGRDWSLTRLAAMAITMLLLMPFAWGEPLLKLYLLGVRIDANVLQGIWQMTRQGDPLTAAMVLFCTVGAPLVLVAAIAYLWFGNILGMNLRVHKSPGLCILAARGRTLCIYLPGLAQHPHTHSSERRTALGALLPSAPGHATG